MGLKEEQMNMRGLFLKGLFLFCGFHLLPWTQLFCSCNKEHICSSISQYTQDTFLGECDFQWKSSGWFARMLQCQMEDLEMEWDE